MISLYLHNELYGLDELNSGILALRRKAGLFFQNPVHKQPDTVQNDAGARLVDDHAHLFCCDGFCEHDAFVADGGFLGDSAPVAVLILDFYVELLHPLSKRDVLL